ncbi:hypothetical protein ACH5RR_029337 [Cinchona calisaya]|uniref:Uncharacterized protein n=1 Tax=Cinchona calisaya TaxID=153742 RepID=A0ABD2YTL8_9GENT
MAQHWMKLIYIKEPVCDGLVKQYYASLTESENSPTTLVKSVCINFDSTIMNFILECPDEGSDFCSSKLQSPIINAEEFMETLYLKHKISKARTTTVSHIMNHLMYAILWKVLVNYGAFLMGYMCLKNQKSLCFDRIITLILNRFEVPLNPKSGKGAATLNDCICATTLKKLNMDVVNGRRMYCHSGMQTTISLGRSILEFIHNDISVGNVQSRQNTEGNEQVEAKAATSNDHLKREHNKMKRIEIKMDFVLREFKLAGYEEYYQSRVIEEEESEEDTKVSNEKKATKEEAKDS